MDNLETKYLPCNWCSGQYLKSGSERETKLGSTSDDCADRADRLQCAL